MSEETPVAHDAPIVQASARAAALAATGCRAFDGPALACVESLLTRARAFGGGAGARLAARASLRLDDLEAAFSAARAASKAQLDALAVQKASNAELIRAFSLGDFTTVLWHAPRHARHARRPKRPTAPRHTGARARFRASAAEANAALTVARAEAALPKDSGAYNALALAVKALKELSRLSSPFLAVYLSALEDLSTVTALPALSRVSPSVRGKKRR